MYIFLLFFYYKLIIGNFRIGTRLCSKEEKIYMYPGKEWGLRINVSQDGLVSGSVSLSNSWRVWLREQTGSQTVFNSGLDSHQAEKCLHSGVLSDNSLLRRKEDQIVRPGLEGSQIYGPGGLTWSPLHCLSCSLMDVWMCRTCNQTWMRAMFGREPWIEAVKKEEPLPNHRLYCTSLGKVSPCSGGQTALSGPTFTPMIHIYFCWWHLKINSY